MQRHDFLAALHARLRPRNYLEIGVGAGLSLTLSRVPSLAIDPDFAIRLPLRADLSLERTTSDKFFARKTPLGFLQGSRNPWRNLRHNRPLLGRLVGDATVDLAFIDGMHLFEFAFRDFMNVERFAAPTTVIVFDDMLPRSHEEAARDRTTRDWTGDVYKLTGVLRSRRPDLISVTVDTEPTGVMVVLLPDRRNTVLRSYADEIVATEVVDGAVEVVPDGVLRREGAVDPEAFLASGFCETLRRARRLHLPASTIRSNLRRDLAAFAGAIPSVTSEQPPT